MALLRRCFSSANESRAIVQTIRPPVGARKLAQPLTFLTYITDPIGKAKFTDWSIRFASKGYESLFVQMHVFPSAEQGSFKEMSGLDIEAVRKYLGMLQEDYISSLRISTTSPFPPLLFSHSASTLLAETYVSSHPLSGMVLCSPLSLSEFGRLGPSNPSKRGTKEGSKVTPTPASSPPSGPTQDLFNYEPGFPIAITLPRLTVVSASMDEQHRLLRDFGDDGEQNVEAWIEEPTEEDNWQRVMDWMDANRF